MTQKKESLFCRLGWHKWVTPQLSGVIIPTINATEQLCGRCGILRNPYELLYAEVYP